MVITSPSGRSYRWDKPNPPTEADIAALQEFDSQQAAPELVAGSEPQMQEQRARNVQRELGLQEPVAPSGGVPVPARMFAGFAPTAPEKRAYYETEFGKGSFIPISENNALVRIPDGKGGMKWVVENPQGMEMGDIAEMASSVPEIVTGAAAAFSTLPGPQGMVAKAAVASGAAALAGNIYGAAQDAAYRYATDTPIDPQEIARRRGIKSVTELIAGAALGVGVERFAKMTGTTKAAGEALRRFAKEGQRAKESLKKLGISPNSSGDVADALRALEPSDLTAVDAGEKVANALTDLDRIIQQGSQRMIEGAGRNVQSRLATQVGQATQAQAVPPAQAGLAAIASAKRFVSQGQQQVDNLYTEAYDEIAKAAQAAGEGKYFVSLQKTNSAIEDIVSSLPRKDSGEAVDVFTPLVSQLKSLNEMTGVGQKLDAMRTVRTMLGERIKGKGGVFGDLQESVAKRLYGAISQDIDDSIRVFSGPGADKLKAANEAYKKLLLPFEESKLLDDIVNDGFQMAPEDLVARLADASATEWRAIKGIMPKNTYAAVRRSVADKLVGTSEVRIGNEAFADLGNLSRNMERIAERSPEILDEIFGSRQVWQSLKRLGDEQQFIQSKQGLFTSPKLPGVDALQEVRSIAESRGYDAANQFLKRAIGAAEKRRESLAQSLVSLSRNGNTRHISENPEQFFDAFVLSGKHDARYVETVMKRLPPDVREQVSVAAYQHLFDRAKDISKSVIGSQKGSYNANEMLKLTMGSQQAQARVKAAIGEQRFENVKNWMKYQLALEMRSPKGGMQIQRLAGLISTAPYQNLFAARATATALESISGSRFISGATPEAVELFATARGLSLSPVKSAATIAAVQKAASSPLYGDYLQMMQDFTPEQQNAIDAYLLGMPSNLGQSSAEFSQGVFGRLPVSGFR